MRWPIELFSTNTTSTSTSTALLVRPHATDHTVKRRQRRDTRTEVPGRKQQLDDLTILDLCARKKQTN